VNIVKADADPVFDIAIVVLDVAKVDESGNTSCLRPGKRTESWRFVLHVLVRC
jgi:hypothetical protein